MKSHLTLFFSGLIAAAAVSCSPYVPGPPYQQPADVASNHPTPDKKVENPQSADPSKKKPSTDLADNKKNDRPAIDPPSIPDRTPDPDPGPATPKPKPSIPTAKPVPGQKGFVFSPYNNVVIDVQGYPSGTLVSDPNFDKSEKKYFRVP